MERVRERLLRATAALENAGVPYSVIGGHAVAVWVSRVDAGAVRNTQDVDLLVRREDFDRAKSALESAGFTYALVLDVNTFLEAPDMSPRHSVHVMFANEKVREKYATSSPDTDDSVVDKHFRVVSLEALVQMKLTSFRRKDQVHVLDMIEVGLVDQTWVNRLPTPLAERLQELLDNPDT